MEMLKKIKEIIMWPFKKMKEWWHNWG